MRRRAMFMFYCKAESSQVSSQGVIARGNISVKRAYQRG